MKKEDTEMMLRIFETERAGYAYLYPSDGGERKEDYIISGKKMRLQPWLKSG